jgi:hypothetical protein
MCNLIKRLFVNLRWRAVFCLCAQWEVASNKPRVRRILKLPLAHARASELANSAADLIRRRYIKGNKASPLLLARALPLGEFLFHPVSLSRVI